MAVVKVADEAQAAKPQKKSSGMMAAVAVVIIVIVATAVAVPVAIIYTRDAAASPPAAPPVAPPPVYNVQVSFTAAGDVSDYDAAEQDAILSTLSTAAGFASVPADATLTVTAGSTNFLAMFPVADDAAAQAAKVSLQDSLPDHTSVQTLLATAVPSIIVETLPRIKAATGTEPVVEEDAAPFALVGHWITGWGTALTFTATEEISISTWGSSITPITYYTDEFYVIQKSASDDWNPKKFQKIHFHTAADGSIAFCTAKTDADTEAEAIAFDPTGVYYSNTTQCGSFSHTFMTPYTIPVAGSWAGDYGEMLTITDTAWKSVASWGTTERTIKAYGPNFAIAQMPADDEWNPSKWQVIEWHDKTADGFKHCTTMMDSNTFHDAFGFDSIAAGAYNVSDPTGGCGTSGFAHSVVTKA